MPTAPLSGLDPRRLDWNLLRAFVVVADQGAMSRATDVLGLSQPTVSRQIAELEAQVGTALFERVARGLQLTEIGNTLLEPAKRMLAAAQALSLAAAGQDQAIAGTVRITASEVMSAFILPPILARLAAAQPGIEVELVASNRVDNLLEREADIAIRMVRPTQTGLIARKIAEWPLGFYARRDYIDNIAVPLEMASLHRHRWVGLDQSGQMIDGFRAAGFDVDRHFFQFRCDNQIVGLQAVRAGLGCGIAIRHLAQTFPELVQFMPEQPLPSLPVWLTAHRELRATPRIGIVFDFLAEALAEFGDEGKPTATL
ncbi:LysR family transcriptional regulator [Andreprevotia chitinilytica]|uniref:LysR family transcriptional regulator n=1 Tax=Andreprevotia chitinilytica TaxID=396808 RepID=UPI00068EE848|nr:LysR family transcriptional regulator [Andreprevotia chitinilytica]